MSSRMGGLRDTAECVTYIDVKYVSFTHKLMAALPNTGGALCSAQQSLADAHY